jgi:hypothetical protein
MPTRIVLLVLLAIAGVAGGLAEFGVISLLTPPVLPKALLFAAIALAAWLFMTRPAK